MALSPQGPGDASAGAPFAHSAMSMVLVSALSAIVAFLSSVVVARALGPAGKGAYDMAVTGSQLLAGVLGASIPAAITYSAARYRVPDASLARLGSVSAVVVGMLAAAMTVLITGSGRFPALTSVFSRWSLALVLGLGTAAVHIGLAWRGLLLGRAAVGDVNRADVASKALMLAGLVGASAYWWASGAPASAPVLVTVFVGSALAQWGLYARAARRTRRTGRGDSGWPRGLARYAAACHAGNLLQALNYRLDVFIVGVLLSLSAVGQYTLAVGVAQLLWLASSAFSGLLLARVSASDRDSRSHAEQTCRVSRISLAVGCAGALLLATFSWAIPPVFGRGFTIAVVALLWLLPGVALFTVVNVLAAHIAGRGKPGTNTAVAFVGVVVTIALDYLLIPFLGIAGAAIASSASYAISTALTVLAFGRLESVAPSAVLILRRSDVRVVRAAIAAAARGAG